MGNLTRYINWMQVKEQFKNSTPFNHVIIDNFFQPHIAEQLATEFPSYNNPGLGFYDNAIENKKVSNKWDKFPKLTYQVFTYLAREEFLRNMRELVDDTNLYMDIGLNGGGWHMHGRGGKNNVHLDYNIHPKLGEQRKLNIIIYMTPEWQSEWGGGLELWTHDPETNRPKNIVKTVENKFNRAVIFDTTQNSWHGLPHPIDCPEDKSRNSLAIYYLSTPQEGAETHTKAYFAPTKEQENDKNVIDFIQVRAGLK